MMKFVNWKNANYLFGISILTFLIIQGKSLGPDSIGYIEAIPIRSAGYSILILLFKYIFGAYGMQMIFITQLLFVFFAIQNFLNFLRTRFQLNEISVFLVSILFYYYFIKYGRNISTEPFAFGLFLICIKYLIESVFNKNQKFKVMFFIFLFALILIRAQFYFLLPIVFLVILYEFYIDRRKGILFKNFLLIILVFTSVNLSDKVYHYFQHGSFIGTPFTGLQIVTDALYISHKSDSLLFSDSKKEMFKTILNNIDNQKLTLSSLQTEKPSVGPSEIIFHYTHSYNDICHRNTKVVIGSYFDSPEDIEYWKKIDIISLDMARKLILKHPVDFFKLYIYDILRNGFFSNVYLIFFLVVFFYGLIKIYKNPNDLASGFLVLSSLIVGFNLLLVALVEPVMDRYTFYTSVVYFSSLFVFISKGEIETLGRND